MCRPASMIVTKGPKAVWSAKEDSHSKIRREFGMPENGVGRVTSVQVEIVPEREDFALPLNEWQFVVDQDTLPDWWDKKEAEKECRAELEKWAKVRLVRHGEKRDVKDGENVTAICGGTVSEIRGGTVSAIWGGTVCFCRIFKVKVAGTMTVVIDRTKDVARCFVGTKEEREISSEDK